MAVTLTAAGQIGAVEGSTGGGCNLGLIIAGVAGGAGAAAAVALTANGGVGTGAPCLYTLTPANLTFGVDGGSSQVSVTTSQGDCAWTATSNTGWLTISSGASITGNGTVTLSASVNPSTQERTATVTIGQGTMTQTLAVTQEGGPLIVLETLIGNCCLPVLCTFTVNSPRPDGTDVCERFTFDTVTDGQITATMTYQNGNADLDLYLVSGQSVLASSVTRQRGTFESITEIAIPPGQYFLAVHDHSRLDRDGEIELCGPDVSCINVGTVIAVTRPR